MTGLVQWWRRRRRRGGVGWAEPVERCAAELWRPFLLRLYPRRTGVPTKSGGSAAWYTLVDRATSNSKFSHFVNPAAASTGPSNACLVEAGAVPWLLHLLSSKDALEQWTLPQEYCYSEDFRRYRGERAREPSRCAGEPRGRRRWRQASGRARRASEPSRVRSGEMERRTGKKDLGADWNREEREKSGPLHADSDKNVHVAC